MEAVADPVQSGVRCFRIPQTVHRFKATIENEADPLVQPATQYALDPCGPVPAGLQPDRIPARRPYPRFGNRKKGIHARLLRTYGHRPASCVPGPESHLTNQSAASPQKKRRTGRGPGDKPRRTGGRRCSKKRPPDVPRESGRACRTLHRKGQISLQAPQPGQRSAKSFICDYFILPVG